MRKLLFLSIVVAGLVSCQPDKDGPVADPTVLINTDSEVLNQRFSLEGA